MAEKRGAQLLAQAKKAKQKQVDQSLTKIVGKKKNKAKFNKVNFNG